MAEAPWMNSGSGRSFMRVAVAETLSGLVALPLHVLSGEKPGPVLGITTTVHGDETLPAMMVKRLLDETDPARLSGRICAIPVCNPPAMGAFNRQTPEQHGKTDLHEVFPGNPRGNLTQMIAHQIASNLIDHVDVHIDYHCGGSGGRLQDRVDVNSGADAETRQASIDLARKFGTKFIHENNLAGTAVGHANGRGKVAFNAETSGVYLGPAATEGYVDAGVEGFRNVMRALGMLSEDATPDRRQLLFSAGERREANPTRGGFLKSFFEDPKDLGKRVAGGDTLGEIIDMHSLETVEELKSPVDGFLFFSRYSGVVDAGTKAFAIAAEQGSEWIS